MAFFSAVSSSIGKKLLLFGLRRIDILDKDPEDFVSVAVGKTTTLEVRDVGLHVKKLVSLLHLNLPPEIHLSKAKASLLRVTFILDFGVPQIIIEVDGVRVHARISDTIEPVHSKPRGKEPTSPRPRTSPPRRASSPAPATDYDSDASSQFGDDQVSTVDDLAQSFIREEPAEEIRELEEALHTQSEYLHESVSSNEDGDDEGGVGTHLGLPTMLRNLLNTALDRLKIVANHIDIEVEDQSRPETSDASSENEDAFVSLNFHVDRISIDSITAQDPHVDITTTNTVNDPTSLIGKRRMRVENIYARLISDADNFATMARLSRSSSPADTRSVVSSSQKSQSEASSRIHASARSGDQEFGGIQESDILPTHTSQVSATSPQQKPKSSPAHSRHEGNQLTSSVLTTDEDRFADAGSEDGLDRSEISDAVSQSQQSLGSRGMTSSSLMYDDEGVLDYALENNLFDSTISDNARAQSPRQSGVGWGNHAATSGHESAYYTSEGNPTSSDLFFANTIENTSSPSHNDQQHLDSSIIPEAVPTTDNLDAAMHHNIEHDGNSAKSEPASPEAKEDLAESKLFTHDDAESMYMSAMSGGPSSSNYRVAIPGGWDSASTSSQDTSSDTSAPIPASMVAGSILVPLSEVDDGCETPRPGSRQSMPSPSLSKRGVTQTSVEKAEMTGIYPPETKVAKLFLTIDHVTVWFPLGLSEDQPKDTAPEQDPELPEFSFSPPNLAQDSIFQEMPGSFSNYAQSISSRRKGSIDVTTAPKRRPVEKPAPVEDFSKPTAKEVPATISVDVGSVACHIDLSTGRLMFQMMNRVLQSMTESTEQERQATVQKTPQSAQSMELSARHIHLAWLERIVPESLVRSESPRHLLETNPLDAIISLNLSTIHVASRVKTGETRSKLLIGKFVLSSLDQDIISFISPRPRSRRSANNSSDQLSNDVEIDFQRGKDSRITVVTRPVKVTFDMRKLDDALGSFGGFSGVLELGSSISSSNAANSPTVSVSPSRPRGVHFGDTPPTAPPHNTHSAGSSKIQVQLGEVTFVLKGKSCAMQLQTTSIRAAIRDNNVRMKISELQLTGPYVDVSDGGPPLIVEVKGSTVNFLFAPEEVDLTKLISMITPSKNPYENDEDILIDTLLRQRRKGSVLRAEVTSVGVRISDLAPLQTLEALGAEMVRLSKVTKYLPDDDRPGILTLASVQQFDASVMVNEKLGDMSLSLQDASVAHVGVPSLLAVEVGKISVSRGEEVLIHEVVKLRPQDQLPMIMTRIVGDELEPVIKAKIFNLCAEYHVSTVMAALGLSEDGTTEDIALGLASSVATITGASSTKTLSRQTSESSSPAVTNSKPIHIDLLLRSCALGLNPRKLTSKSLFVLTDAHFLGNQAKKDDYSIAVELRRASVHAIDDTGRISDREMPPSPAAGSSIGQRQLFELRDQGYVSLSSISAAKVLVDILGDGKDQPQVVDIEFKNELFVLESCADSTQTLIAILSGLQPPTPPSTAQRYRTVVPLQEMMESFTGDAMATPEGMESESFMDNADLIEDELPTNLEFVGSIYNSQSLPTEEDLGDSLLGEDDLGALATPPLTRQRGDQRLLESFQEKYEVAEGEQDFDFNEDYFKDSDSDHKGKARKWDSRKNEYHLTNEFKTPDAPLKVRVRDVNIVWNLFDGYDWPKTRAVITQAVEDVEARAEERRQRSRDEDEEDDDFVEQDFLFNSVWIGVPIKDEKGALAKQINRDIDDLVSETGSYATSTATRSTGATVRPRSATKLHRRKLKLERSKNKKIGFELSGVAVDMIVFPQDTGETQNSLNVRVRDFEIYDYVPSSTWNKFLTSLIDPSQREMARPIIDLELLTVKPVTELAASELVIRATVLPLRLHVDQDALDFITRFFEFKDDSVPENTAPSEQPFIQRLEVMSVTLKLDYKPKRVDYRGLRSGHTTEFMNFLILDGSDIILRHAIVYGITSFDKLHKTLNDVWMPDVKSNQLPGVLAGLAAVRPIVNVGSGVRDLIVVPMREYKKDGRIVRSLQKGVYAFAKNTTSEVARLGAKVAIGTQNLLEGAENFLNPQSASPRSPSTLHDWDDLDPSDASEEERRAVSNYANQPIGVKAGLRSAARYLERDLLTARDAIIAIPTEVMEEGTGVGMAKAIARRAPTVILRPALGATKAVSNALLGVGNALDKDSRRKIDDKYKSY